MEKGGGKSRWLVAALFSLLFLIVGLIISIIVVKENQKEYIAKQEEEIEAVVSGGEATEDQLNNYIKDVDKQIAEASTNDEKAKLYADRASYLCSYISRPEFEKYKEQILSDAYKAEELNPTAFSAYNISYYERMFGNEEQVNQYYDLAKERGLNEQIQDTSR
ncbi:hypothetical protein IKD67_01155 [Candidatus Saccharibacteria bacterium]|nr:hypothetical protein [Candidatus Saccharibacteria bacterium]